MILVIDADRKLYAKLLERQLTQNHGGYQSWIGAALLPILNGERDSSFELQAIAEYRFNLRATE